MSSNSKNPMIENVECAINHWLMRSSGLKKEFSLILDTKRNFSWKRTKPGNGLPQEILKAIGNSGAAPGGKNMLLRQQKEYSELEQDSLELLLEREFVKCAYSEWHNQMPIWGKRNAVDLVWGNDHGEFWFYELKVHSNHWLEAALEVLRYGMAYRATRDKKANTNRDLEILRASAIHLRVLAPAYKYKSIGPIKSFQTQVNSDLRDLGDKPIMTFQFEKYALLAPPSRKEPMNPQRMQDWAREQAQSLLKEWDPKKHQFVPVVEK